MKIDINDPRITAFALGELTGSDATEIARAVRSDLRIRATVEEVRETAALLHGTIGGGEVNLLTSEQREACLLYTSPSPRDQRGSRMPSSA